MLICLHLVLFSIQIIRDAKVMLFLVNSLLSVDFHTHYNIFNKKRGNGNHSAAPPSCEPFRFKFSILLLLCKLLLHLLGDDLKEVEVQNKGKLGEIPGSIPHTPY